MLGHHPAADEQHHQHRHQGDGQQRAPGHGEGFGEGQWPEHAAFLILQGEHRQERHGDDGQAEEQRRADLDGGLGDHLQARLARGRAFEMLVGILDHHDGGVDHGAEGDGDAAE